MKKRILYPFILWTIFSLSSKAQANLKGKDSVLTFEFTYLKDGNEITISPINGGDIAFDSLEKAERIRAFYKVDGDRIKVNYMKYICYVLQANNDWLVFDNMESNGSLELDSCHGWNHFVRWKYVKFKKGNQFVFKVKEIILEDGSVIKNPKLEKELRSVWLAEGNGWTKSNSNQIIKRWKEFFQMKNKVFYKFTSMGIEFYCWGVVFTLE